MQFPFDLAIQAIAKIKRSICYRLNFRLIRSLIITALGFIDFALFPFLQDLIPILKKFAFSAHTKVIYLFFYGFLHRTFMNEIFWVVKHCLIASTKSTVILKNKILSKIHETLEAELIRKNNKIRSRYCCKNDKHVWYSRYSTS